MRRSLAVAVTATALWASTTGQTGSNPVADTTNFTTGEVLAAHHTAPLTPRTTWMRRPCHQEDSVNCQWNAKARGNGHGHSYYTVETSLASGVTGRKLGRVECRFYLNHHTQHRFGGCFRLAGGGSR